MDRLVSIPDLVVFVPHFAIERISHGSLLGFSHSADQLLSGGTRIVGAERFRLGLCTFASYGH
jgi:hypothetical protein